MAWLVNALIKIASNPAGQAALSWLVGHIWNLLNDKFKKEIAKNDVEKMIKESLDEYEKVLEKQRVLSLDGLTDEEKNEIRKAKIAIQVGIFNNRP